MSLVMETDIAKATLLLVEDEASLLVLLRRYLERLGYSIQSAGTGESALALIQEAEPDVVVLDLGLPDMPGMAVLETILRTTTKPRVLVSSGTPFSPETLPPCDRERVGFLQKPYLTTALLDAMEALLAGRPTLDSGE
jgi:DNA-binding response OmpR family regulator